MKSVYNKIFLYTKHPIILLYIIAIFLLILFNFTPQIKSFDTPYYFLAGENWWNGKIDCLRTPVYPLILKICSILVGGKSVTLLITLIQSVCFLLSINSFYKLCQYIINNTYFCFVLTILYIIYPSIGWCNELLTESLSISGCVILTHLIFKLIDKKSMNIIICITLILILLIFLRPTFIIFLAILPVLWLWLWIVTRNTRFVWALFLCAVPIGSYYTYCNQYEKQYGIFTSTIFHECNIIYNLKRSNCWDVLCLKNPHDINISKRIDNMWTCNYSRIYQIVEESNDAKSINEICQQMVQQHKVQYSEYKLRNLFNGLSETFPCGVNSHGVIAGVIFVICKLISIPLSTLYFVVVLSLLWLLFFIIRHHKVPIYLSIIVAVVTAQCVGISISASEAYSRLMLPVYPIFLLLIGFTFYKISLLMTKKS